MRRSWRCMAALLLMIMILVSGGCQNIRHLSVSQSEKDDADTGTGYNIYYINNDETKIKAFAYQLSSTTEDGIISECMEALAVSPDDKNYKAVIASSVKVQQYQYDKDSRTLTLYFSREYEQLSRTSEMLVRTAIVKTMTQFGGIIDYFILSLCEFKKKRICIIKSQWTWTKRYIKDYYERIDLF